MKRVRVKICGLCSAADVRSAADAGADAIGLVFFKRSSRLVTLDQAIEISAQLPPFVARVALFLDATADEVAAVCERLRPDFLQFHGRETPDFCRAFYVPYIKAVPMADMDGGADLAAWAEAYHDARALLLDAHSAGEAGGQGSTFGWHGDWQLPDMPIVVAGGLSVDNVAAAIERFAPYAVDVSSGVESAPGVKNAQRMHAFVDAVLATSSSSLQAVTT